MNGQQTIEPQGVGRWALKRHRGPTTTERRRTERIPVRLAFDVYDPFRYVGRFWSRDLSKEGLFLDAKPTDPLTNTILSLRFVADGMERRLRGTAVHGVPGEGVGIQLAVWRRADQADHRAYRQLLALEHPARQGCL